MKKILVFFLFISFSSLGQIAFHDAVYLDKLAGKETSLPEEAVLIINQYYKLPFTGNVLAVKLNEELKKNPFLDTFEINIGDLGASSLLKGFPASSIGNLDVTNFADGLARFLVERTKQELSTTFFERFKTDMDSALLLRTLFPQSYIALQAIDREIYNYAAYIDLLRNSFQKDVSLLLPNISHLVNHPKMDGLFNKYPTIKIILSDGLFLINQLNDGKHPGEAIHNYIRYHSSDLDSINPDLPASIKTLDLFSQSLRSTKEGEYWIMRDQLDLLFKGNSLRIYLGLMYQQALEEKIKFTNITLDNAFKALAKSFTEAEKIYKPYLSGLLEKGKTVDASFRTLKNTLQAEKSTAAYQDYYALYNSSLDLFEYLLQSPLLIKRGPITPEKDLAQYLSAARGLGNIYVDIYEKQYGSAIVEFSIIYQNLLEDKLAAVIAGNKKDSEELKKELKVVPLLVKYGGFAAAVAKAENSDDVKVAIEAIALPAGSSRIKRETPFNVAVNGYLGLFGGWERIADVDEEAKGAFGVFAPVGISISRGHSIFFLGTGKEGWNKNKRGWSSSLFISIIDIGALASFRFEESNRNVNDTILSVSQVPSIKLKDIISPGVFYSLGIPKSPLSLTFGAQLGANLRKVNALTPDNVNITNQYNDKMYWRFSISLLVDLPLLNLYTKSL